MMSDVERRGLLPKGLKTEQVEISAASVNGGTGIMLHPGRHGMTLSRWAGEGDGACTKRGGRARRQAIRAAQPGIRPQRRFRGARRPFSFDGDGLESAGGVLDRIRVGVAPQLPRQHPQSVRSHLRASGSLRRPPDAGKRPHGASMSSSSACIIACRVPQRALGKRLDDVDVPAGRFVRPLKVICRPAERSQNWAVVPRTRARSSGPCPPRSPGARARSRR